MLNPIMMLTKNVREIRTAPAKQTKVQMMDLLFKLKPNQWFKLKKTTRIHLILLFKLEKPSLNPPNL
tara:strand:- start:159 stop:359 length:201 start_codon:yes stop_codon:yes gene_type:complete